MIKYYKEFIKSIPFNFFCVSLLETEDKKCILGWLGVEDSDTKWYNINEVPLAKDFNYLFVKYLYPILKSKGVIYNQLLLEQGKIVFGVNDNDLKVCLPLNINHKTVKGRLLQALNKIEQIIESEKLLDLAMNAEDADYIVLD